MTNHTADVIHYEGGQNNYLFKTTTPYRDANGVAFDDTDFAGTGRFPTLSPTQSFPYTPVIEPNERNIKVPAWLNAPIYYHNRGDTYYQDESTLYGDVAGLDDLFTEHPKVQQGMIDIYKMWITDYDIDGFRVDTTKHVNAHFWRAFNAAILAHARATGKDDFFIFGEAISEDAQFLSYYTTDSDMPAVLDFRLQSALRNYVSQGDSANNLRALFESDDFFIDEDSNAYSLPSFVSTHDGAGRIGHLLNPNNITTLDDAALQAPFKLAYAIMFLARGVPIIYYGDEQGFTGDGGDKDARQDMFPSQVASYNDDDQIGTKATTASDSFSTTHPFYQAFSSYAALDQAHPALQFGAQVHRYAADGAGIYAFSRIDRDEQIEYIVAVNNGAAATANVPTFYSGGITFTQLYVEGGNAPDLLTTDSNGQLPVSVPAMGFVVYRSSQPIPPSTAAPAITLSTLTSNQEITLGFQNIDGNQMPARIEIRADLTSTQFTEVTFAVRETGTEEFTLLGVDDNPPYRLFYDGSAWPDNTQLDFIAVVNDLNDHYSSALVQGIRLTYQRPSKPNAQASAYHNAAIHYQRSDGSYGDATSADANAFWGLHLWGDGLALDEITEWTAPKPFRGEDSYGRFAWMKVLDASKDIGFIIHQGENKDGTDQDRFFNPLTDGPQIWLKQDDPTIYRSQAAAQGYVTIHYNRPDGDYAQWGLHLWGEGIADENATEWTHARPIDGMDDFGVYWTVPIIDASQPLNFVIHQGEERDPGADQSLLPQENASVWLRSGDETIYPQLCAATSQAVIHYHRPAGDYGDYASEEFADFWGLHAWNATEDPGWETPYKPTAHDLFGIIFQLPVDQSAELGYIIHQGDNKDPGPDQMLDFDQWGCEIWQVQDAKPEAPYLLPILKATQP